MNRVLYPILPVFILALFSAALRAEPGRLFGHLLAPDDLQNESARVLCR